MRASRETRIRGCCAGSDRFVDDIEPAACSTPPASRARTPTRASSVDRRRPGPRAARRAPGPDRRRSSGRAQPAVAAPDPPSGADSPRGPSGRSRRTRCDTSGRSSRFVVADDRYVAEDAVGLIDVQLRAARRPSSSSRRALEPGSAARARATCPGTARRASSQRAGDRTRPSPEAAHVLQERLYIERSCGSPIEARGVVAEHDRRGRGQLRVWASTQAPLPIKNRSRADVRPAGVQGRGHRAGHRGAASARRSCCSIPRRSCVPHAAMRLGRPVKWTEDRREHFVSASQERGQRPSTSRSRVDATGRILGLRDRFRPRRRRLHALRHRRSAHHRRPSCPASTGIRHYEVAVRRRLHQQGAGQRRTAAPAARTAPS